MHFLAKKGQMTLEKYVDQVLRILAVLFYKKCLGKIEEMIYMDDGTAYYTSKLTKEFYVEVGLLYMI